LVVLPDWNLGATNIKRSDHGHPAGKVAE